MSERTFYLSEFNRSDKRVWIESGDSNLRLCLDFDDVGHIEAAQGLRKVLRILNAHWFDPQYAEPARPSCPDEETDPTGYDAWWDSERDEADRIMRSLVGEQTDA